MRAEEELLLEDDRRGGRSRSLAAFLSFLWPGLGQLYRGRVRSGVLQAIPVALALLALVVLAAGGMERLAARFFVPAVALGSTAAICILGLWRIFSIVDARRRSRVDSSTNRSRRSLAVALVLSAVVVVSHGYAAYFAYSFYRVGEVITEPLPTTEPTPAPTLVPGASATPEPPAPEPPAPTSTPELPTAEEMVNVLFVGIDRGANANANTDTMMLASFDPRTDQIVMLSIPRDTAQVPLYSGGVWNRKINALYHYAATHPDEFPDGGMGTLVREVEYLVGVPIDYYASIEIGGFRQLIDEVGGVDVVLERPINDPTYQHGPDEIGFYMEPGPHHLDGETALAYVRSRHGPGGSDFERARRQQQVLLALRDRVRDPNVVLNLPNLLDAVGETVRTDVPLDRAPELLELVQASQGAEARTIVLGPRRFAQRIPPEEFGGQYALRLNMDEVAKLSIELWGDESRYWRDGVPSDVESGRDGPPIIP